MLKLSVYYDLLSDHVLFTTTIDEINIARSNSFSNQPPNLLNDHNFHKFSALSGSCHILGLCGVNPLRDINGIEIRSAATRLETEDDMSSFLLSVATNLESGGLVSGIDVVHNQDINQFSLIGPYDQEQILTAIINFTGNRYIYHIDDTDVRGEDLARVLAYFEPINALRPSSAMNRSILNNFNFLQTSNLQLIYRNIIENPNVTDTVVTGLFTYNTHNTPQVNWDTISDFYNSGIYPIDITTIFPYGDSFFIAYANGQSIAYLENVSNISTFVNVHSNYFRDKVGSPFIHISDSSTYLEQENILIYNDDLASSTTLATEDTLRSVIEHVTSLDNTDIENANLLDIWKSFATNTLYDSLDSTADWTIFINNYATIEELNRNHASAEAIRDSYNGITYIPVLDRRIFESFSSINRSGLGITNNLFNDESSPSTNTYGFKYDSINEEIYIITNIGGTTIGYIFDVDGNITIAENIINEQTFGFTWFFDTDSFIFNPAGFIETPLVADSQ